MNRMVVSEFVAAPVERVFASASNFPRAAELVEAITAVEVLTPGPIGVGTRFRETRMMFGRSASEEMTVVEFEPPHRYVLAAESHGSRYRSELTFVPEAAGTRMTMTFEGVPLTFFAKVMSVLMKPMMKKMSALITKDLTDIKAAIERGA